MRTVRPPQLIIIVKRRECALLVTHSFVVVTALSRGGRVIVQHDAFALPQNVKVHLRLVREEKEAQHEAEVAEEQEGEFEHVALELESPA